MINQFSNWKTIDLKNLLFFFYIFLPLTFYGIPFIYSLLNEGGLKVHFFNDFFVPTKTFFVITIGHIILGFLILRALRSTRFKLVYRVQNDLLYSSFICLFYVVVLFTNLGYFSTLTYGIFLLMISTYRPNGNTFMVLLLIALVKMIFTYDRFPVIYISLIWFLPTISKYGFFKLLLSATFGILLLVFVLQPLRAGLLPFTGPATSAFYIVTHMYPIYIAAFLEYSSAFQPIQIIGESFPLFKSILGLETSVEIIAKKSLPREILYSGTRLGSNTSLYFNSIFGMLILGTLTLIIKIYSSLIKSQYYYNTILILILLEGPYFIRRSFGSVFIQLTIISFIIILWILVKESKIRLMQRTP